MKYYDNLEQVHRFYALHRKSGENPAQGRYCDN